MMKGYTGQTGTTFKILSAVSNKRSGNFSFFSYSCQKHNFQMRMHLYSLPCHSRSHLVLIIGNFLSHLWSVDNLLLWRPPSYPGVSPAEVWGVTPLSLTAADKLIFSSEEMLAAGRGTSITLYLDSQDLMDTTIKRKAAGLKWFRRSQV